MKKTFRTLALVTLLTVTTLQAAAQQVNTLYFLDNAPMRHIFNPALQPVSKGYFSFTPLGYTSFWAGNNSLTLSDALYRDPLTGRVITPLHPNGDKQAFLRRMRPSLTTNGDITMGLLNMGFRVQDKGYLYLGLNLRTEVSASLPKSLFSALLDGGMHDLDGVNYMNLSRLNAYANAYMEVSGGYSHRINDQWTVGGKVKALLGYGHVGLTAKDLGLEASIDRWRLNGTLDLRGAVSLVDGTKLPEAINKEWIENGEFDFEDYIATPINYLAYAKPCGYGAAVDLGLTYAPLPQLQLSAAITDLGVMAWQNGFHYSATPDFIYEGVDLTADKYITEDGQFDTDILWGDVTDQLLSIVDGATLDKDGSKHYLCMPTARLNVGVDGRFWENRLGLGVLSQTRFRSGYVSEEVTFGASLKPCNWFNLAVSYSLMDNGRYSNVGAGLGFMPYDGINLTLAADYIPTTFVDDPSTNGGLDFIPYKSKGLNLAFGISICWGSNQRDKDHDGVKDKWDLCPNTPKGVEVDSVGCPKDSDGDGVPDYLDQCPGTPEAAYGMIDSVGCPLDTDGDGVPDYLDECPNTPKEAFTMLTSTGCPKDSDGDGVPDYMDECNNTPSQAIGYTDEKGCLLDTDGDGIPDYMDECPSSPKEALVDAKGCELDSDGDGVPDWRDECSNTRPEAIGHTDDKGCELDTDNDGVADWCDECPTVAGVKANKGCPEIKREVRNILKKAMQGIEFETQSATIKKGSYPLLDQIAKIFIDNPTYIIEVQGHTDATGKAEMNMKLSDERAHSVMNYLIEHGVEAERLSAKGFGSEMPIADNATKEGRQKNRRVEFNITFEEVTYETVLDHAE